MRLLPQTENSISNLNHCHRVHVGFVGIANSYVDFEYRRRFSCHRMDGNQVCMIRTWIQVDTSIFEEGERERILLEVKG